MILLLAIENAFVLTGHLQLSEPWPLCLRGSFLEFELDNLFRLLGTVSVFTSHFVEVGGRFPLFAHHVEESILQATLHEARRSRSLFLLLHHLLLHLLEFFVFIVFSKRLYHLALYLYGLFKALVERFLHLCNLSPFNFLVHRWQ